MTESLGAKRPVRVLVVDDSALCRDLLTSILTSDPSIELLGEACNGEEAVQKVRELQPDLVTMDLRMPVMDGIEATRAIMAECPTPILVVTGHPFQAGRNMTFDAIRAGALDLIIKPDLGNMAEVEELKGDLTRLVRFLASIEVKVHPHPEVVVEAPPAAKGAHLSVVAIASSAGGPGAVRDLLAGLPADFPIPVVLAQHIAEGFARDFAEWLDAECAVSVEVASAGASLGPGKVLVAPDDDHLRLMPGLTCKIVRGAPIRGYRPSADVLLSSAARHHAEGACGVILSGMGDDGVEGLAEIHERGGLTVAQDEGSCTVYGMPAAAVERGVVDVVLPAERIAAELVRRSNADAGL